MTDASSLFATYGPDVVAWVLAALGGVGTLVLARIGVSGYVGDVLQRAWTEVKGAVLEVSQTYADDLKAASEDGELTDTERKYAKGRAIEIARANLGRKGLERLERVIGIDVNEWLASKTEQAVKLLQTAPGDAPLPTFPARADDDRPGTVSPFPPA